VFGIVLLVAGVVVGVRAFHMQHKNSLQPS